MHVAALAGTGFTGSYGFGKGNYLGATWFTRFAPATGESVSNQVRLNGALGLPSWGLRVEGQGDVDPTTLPRAEISIASPGYFQTVGIPVIRGRVFSAHDRSDTEPVAVVSQAMARRASSTAWRQTVSVRPTFALTM